MAQYKQETGKDLSFQLGSPNDSDSVKSAELMKSYLQAGGHEGVDPRGRPVAVHQRRHRGHLPGPGLAQPPGLRPRHADDLVGVQCARAEPAAVGVPRCEQVRQPGELLRLQRRGDQQRHGRCPRDHRCRQAHAVVRVGEPGVRQAALGALGLLRALDGAVADERAWHQQRGAAHEHVGERRSVQQPFLGLASGIDPAPLWIGK